VLHLVGQLLIYISEARNLKHIMSILNAQSVFFLRRHVG